MQYVSLILSIIGLFFSLVAIIQTHEANKFTEKIERERRQDEKEKKYKDTIKNRPQFKIVSYSENSANPGYVKDDSLNLDVLFLPYKSLSCDLKNYSKLYKFNRKTLKQEFIPNGIKGYQKKPICEYEDIYNKKNEWVSFTFELENIGKSNIQFYYLLNGMERYGSLIDIKTDTSYKTLCNYKVCDHVVVSNKNNILVGEHVKLRINFHKDFIFSSPISTSFLLNMETDDGEYWQQGLFLDNHETNQSHQINSEEFLNYYRGFFLDAVMYDRVYWGIVNSRKRKKF